MKNPETSIYAFFLQEMEKHLSEPALWYCGKAIKYYELIRKIDAVAENLFQLGVRKGDSVTIHLPNCPQAVIVIYAVAKLGAVCDLVHPLMPCEGLANHMKITQSGVLVTSDLPTNRNVCALTKTVIIAHLAAHMRLPERAAYRIKNPGETLKGISFEKMEISCSQHAVVPEQESLAEEPVCYMHSSGTTGKAKIVVQSHASLNRYVMNTQEFLHGQDLSKSVTPSVLPFFHAAGLTMVMHQILCNKGLLVVLPRYTPESLLKVIQKKRVDILCAVPAVYEGLLKLPGFHSRKIPTLKQCYVFGDTVSPTLKRAVDLRLDPTGNRHICYESYSFSEVAPGGSSEGPFTDYREGSAGRAMPECRFALLCDGKVQEPPGEGELLLRTNTMMIGYLCEEDNVGAYWDYQGEQWTRSGDYGRIDEDGYIYFLDRIKNVIIHKGYNIYPSEVESVIRKLDFVEDVCAVGTTAEDSNTENVRLCVVLKDALEPSLAKEKIFQAAQKNLPRYALPQEIVFVREIPRNAMNKIDRKRLLQQQEEL